MNDATSGFQIQISGDMPWVVLGWRTYPEIDAEARDLIAVYGPVPTREAADRLIATLAETFPADTENYTAMPAFPVQIAPGGSESAVVAG